MQTLTLEKPSRLSEERNKAITDSLNYARIIQNAFTHKKEALGKVIHDSFLLDMPLDIVSGDFVRVDEKDGKILITLADCTGHGMPGAMMSMIGNTLLADIINSQDKTDPSDILTTLNSRFKNLVNDTAVINDGMDVGCCSIDLNKSELSFAGAYRPLYLVRNNTLYEIKGNRLAIGGHSSESDEFKSHAIKLRKGDSVYMFSDGYADQFGGVLGKKFSTGRLKEVLSSIQYLNMAEQKDYLKKTIHVWKGDLAQVDDICMLGFRF